MQGYDTILVPIDVYSDYELVVEKAIAIAGNSHKIHFRLQARGTGAPPVPLA